MILKDWDVLKIRRANERLEIDPDDLDLTRQRFAGLRVKDEGKPTTRTMSPPPAPNVDVHGLWKEERNRQAGGRHQGPPRLRWNPPICKEALNKRYREQED